MFRPSPYFLFAWRNFLLRLFSANIGRGVHVYPSARIFAPWNLTMGPKSCLGWGVDCYCVDKIFIGEESIISQYAFLCTASHDINSKEFTLLSKPIIIGNKAWVCSRSYVGMGVKLMDGAVVAACGVAVKDVQEWTVVGGNPAVFIGKRMNN
jgi:putative colanic acid biosynthesis acetyltransferase WcaF